MSKYQRTLVAILSDSHAGHTLGLCNPDTIIQDVTKDGQIYNKPVDPNETQKYLWDEVYKSGFDATMQLAGKDEVIVLHDGDLTHGNKHNIELMSTRISDQIDIATYNLKPWLQTKNVKKMRIISGTGAHVFGEATSERLVSARLQEAHFGKDVKMIHHGLLNIHGVIMDIAHHGPVPGKRSWLSGNDARLYLRDYMMRELNLGNEPAHLVSRGHYHTFTKETIFMKHDGQSYESIIIINPSICLMSDFARRATQSGFTVTNGFVVVEIINNKIHDIHEFTKTLDIRTKEEL